MPGKSLLRNVIVAVFIAVLLIAPSIIRVLPTESRVVFSLSDTFNGEPLTLGAIPDLCAGLSRGKSLEVRVTGTIDQLVNYQNFFQTDDENRGIRVEVNDSGAVALLVASDSSDGFDAVVAPSFLEEGPVALTFVIKNGTGLKVLQNSADKSTTSDSLRPSCNNVRIGSGFDSSRVTLGSIVVTFTVTEDVPRFIPTFIVEVLNSSPLRTILLGLLTYSILMGSVDLGTYWETKRAPISGKEEKEPKTYT